MRGQRDEQVSSWYEYGTGYSQVAYRHISPQGRLLRYRTVLSLQTTVLVLAWYSFGTLPRPLSYRTSTLLVRLLRPGVRLGP